LCYCGIIISAKSCGWYCCIFFPRYSNSVVIRSIFKNEVFDLEVSRCTTGECKCRWGAEAAEDVLAVQKNYKSSILNFNACVASGRKETTNMALSQSLGTISTSRIIRIQVPDNAEPGDSLNFQIDGSDLELIVPINSKAGDILELEIGAGSHSDNATSTVIEESDSKGAILTRISLESGDILEIFNPNETADECESDGTYLMSWPAGVHLAKFFCSPAAYDWLKECHTIVELGSGLGVAGMAICSCLARRKSKSQKTQIVFTDLPSALPFINCNILANNKLWIEHIETYVQPLVWGQSDINLPCDSPVDLVIASDVLYNCSESIYINLAQSICSMLIETGKRTKRNKRFILSVRWRKPDHERIFFEVMEKRGILLELVTSFRCGCNHLSWRDFGNPNSDQSNKYFRDTHVNVNGSSLSLADVTEDHMQEMSDDEYDFFESRFIQIYHSTL